MTDDSRQELLLSVIIQLDLSLSAPSSALLHRRLFSTEIRSRSPADKLHISPVGLWVFAADVYRCSCSS